MKIPAGIADYLGVEEGQIEAKANEFLTSESDFTHETRRVEMLAREIGTGFSADIFAQYQFVGIEGGKAYFLRAGRSQDEKEEQAVQKAIQTLMKERQQAPGLPAGDDMLPDTSVEELEAEGAV